MRSLARRAVLTVGFSLLLAGSSWASESGLPVGELVLKPGVRVGFVYDSNVEKRPVSPEGDIGLEVRPYFGALYPGENFRWTLDTYYRLFSYFNIGGNNHDAYRVFTNFGIGTSFDVNRKGKVGFFFAPEGYNRPFKQGPADGPEHEIGIEAPIELRFRPTQAFHVDANAGYTFSRVYRPFRAFDPDPAVLGQRHEVGGGFGIDWRFFPRSHLLIDGAVGGVLWQPEAVNTTVLSSVGRQEDGVYFRVWLGIKGDISRKLSMLAQVGYGNAFFLADPSLNLSGIDGLLGKFEFAIRPVLTQRFALGFLRDYKFRHYSTFVVDTNAYFKYKGLFFGRLGAGVDFTYTFRQLSVGLSRTEHQYSAGVLLELMITEFLHIDAQYRFAAVNPSSTDEGEYLDSRVLIGVTLGFK